MHLPDQVREGLGVGDGLLLILGVRVGRHGLLQVHAGAERRAGAGQDHDADAGLGGHPGQDVAQLGDQPERQGIAAFGPIQGQHGDRTVVLAQDEGIAHEESSVAPGAGTRSSRIAAPSALPCVSSRSDRLAPPPRARSITKLNAWMFGSA